ncbi:MAG: aminotransferase class V-fold PLP-dependent enzyme [bacterium]|nr:aminotransferase class V-fold PLP-dependent enzyme [bacterium]MBU1918161.1 aminotransferase class V-fold PLP-dependent enzyme [bacterium]
MNFAQHWPLDSQIVFLNHGSFGACPIRVLEEQNRLRQEMEKNPVLFLDRHLPALLNESREALANFVKADSADLVFVPNATTGVNAVLASLDFSDGDELLLTDHTYNACLQAVYYHARKRKIKVNIVSLPCPIKDEESIVSLLLEHVTRRTKLVLLDHVTSPTAIVLPVEKLVKEIETKNIPVLIDGAHAPGMLPLEIEKLGASFYTGNCHKWLCAPKGAGFLYVRKDWQDRIYPLTISHAYGQNESHHRFQSLFDWTGTDDPTAYLCVKTAIETMQNIFEGGWPAIMQHNKNVAKKAREFFMKTLSWEPTCPDHMAGSMASFIMPKQTEIEIMDVNQRDSLAKVLFEEHRIEIPIMPWPAHNRRYIRFSAQIYNTFEQYELLATILKKIF